MRKITLAFLLLPILSLAQYKPPRYVTDSSKYYGAKMAQLRRQAQDSLLASTAYQEALEGYKRSRHHGNNYAGFVLFSGAMHSNFKPLNQSLAQSGFPALREWAPLFGIGISGRGGNTLYDFYIVSGSFTPESVRGNESIQANFGNMLHFDLGVNVLPSKIVSLYPYIGFAVKFLNLSYDKPQELNPSYTNPTNMVLNNQEVNLSGSRLAYHAGVGLDVMLGENKRHTTNKILFIKTGIDRTIGKEKYKGQGITYTPGIRQGNWGVAAGIKFGNKN